MWSCIGVLLIAAVGIQAQTKCLCVMYNLCTSNNTISDDGENILTGRAGVSDEACTCPSGTRPRRMGCSDRMHLCCHVRVKTEEPEPRTEKPDEGPKETEEPEPRTVKPAEGCKETEEPEPRTEKPDEGEEEFSWDNCGTKGFNPRDAPSRVIGNEMTMYTTEDEFPWMAMLLNKKNNKMLCGGSILHHHVIMTAAHCVTGFQAADLLVRVGVWDTNNVQDSVTAQVERILPHAEFESGNFRNDIALLVLKQGLQVSEAVAPICLPQGDTSYDNKLCWATGWGVSNHTQRNNSRTLKRVELSIVPRLQCQDELRQSMLGPFFKVHKSFVCANGEDNADTCTGDGGGPLVCLQRGTQKYVQVGIVSTGLECGTGIPALYTNVPHFVPWIQGKFNEWSLKTLNP